MNIYAHPLATLLGAAFDLKYLISHVALMHVSM